MTSHERRKTSEPNRKYRSQLAFHPQKKPLNSTMACVEIKCIGVTTTHFYSICHAGLLPLSSLAFAVSSICHLLPLWFVLLVIHMDMQHGPRTGPIFLYNLCNCSMDNVNDNKGRFWDLSWSSNRRPRSSAKHLCWNLVNPILSGRNDLFPPTVPT